MGEDADFHTDGRRRQLLETIGAIGVAGLAGCLGDDDGTEDGTTDDTIDDTSDDEGAGEPVFEVRDLEPADTTVTWHESVTIEATITNAGDADGERDVELRVGDDEHAVETVSLAPEESETVSFDDIDTGSLEPDEYTYGVYAGNDEDSATLTVVAIGDEPETLFSFDAASSGTVPLTPGAEPVTGTVANPYPFDVESVEIELDSPDGLDVTAVDEPTLEALESGAEETLEWEFDASDDATGEEYEIGIELTYAAGGEDVAVTETVTAAVAGEPSISTEGIAFEDLGPSLVHASAPETDGVPTADGEPAFRFPAGDHQIDFEDDWGGEDDLSADVYLGHDSDYFYVRVDATDDHHNTVPGADMWEGDSIQFGTAVGMDWGAEYAVRHDDEEDEPEIVQYDPGSAAAGQDALDVDTSREGDVTTYELAIPWEALYDADDVPTSGDTIPFDVTVHERDEEDAWRGAISWSDFAVFYPKFPENLGRVTLESDGEERPWEVTPFPEGPDELDAGSEGLWTVTVVNWAETEQEISITVPGTAVEEGLVLEGESAAEVTIEWLLAADETVSVEFSNGAETYTSETDVRVD